MKTTIRIAILAALLASPAAAQWRAVERDARPIIKEQFSFGAFTVDQPGTAPDSVNAPRHLTNGGIDTQDLRKVSGTITLKQPTRDVWFRIIRADEEFHGPAPVVAINGRRLMNPTRDPKMDGWWISSKKSFQRITYDIRSRAGRWRISAHSRRVGVCK